jgi:hypothetical protein
MFVEFDDTCVIKVANFLETSFENVPLDVSIDLPKSLQLLHDLVADGAD